MKILCFLGLLCLISFSCSSALADILPALVWNPIHYPSGDSILSSLNSAGFEATETDNLALFTDSLSNYFLFIMAGVFDDNDSLFYIPDYQPYQAAIDTFLEHGGKCFWEGISSLDYIDYNADTLLFNYFQAVDEDYGDHSHYSFIRGLPGTSFENIDSLGYNGGVFYDGILAGWQGGINEPLCVPYPPPTGCTGKAAVCRYKQSSTMVMDLSWSKFNDNYYNTRRDLITDIMNWLSGSTENTEPEAVPREFSISQNYPNPFNAQTTIKYSLPKSSDVSIDIFDILGRKVETLVSEKQSAGEHSVIWDARNVTSGVYFYKIKAGEFSETKRCLLIK